MGRQELLQFIASDFINVLFRTVARKTQGIVSIRSLHEGEKGEGRGGEGRGGEERGERRGKENRER